MKTCVDILAGVDDLINDIPRKYWYSELVSILGEYW
jgi:hypothetical protein